jgi:hypothetical protein
LSTESSCLAQNALRADSKRGSPGSFSTALYQG